MLQSSMDLVEIVIAITNTVRRIVRPVFISASAIAKSEDRCSTFPCIWWATRGVTLQRKIRDYSQCTIRITNCNIQYRVRKYTYISSGAIKWEFNFKTLLLDWTEWYHPFLNEEHWIKSEPPTKILVSTVANFYLRKQYCRVTISFCSVCMQYT